MNEVIQKKAAAILEVFGIYAAGQLLAFILANILLEFGQLQLNGQIARW